VLFLQLFDFKQAWFAAWCGIWGMLPDRGGKVFELQRAERCSLQADCSAYLDALEGLSENPSVESWSELIIIIFL
jgi:hypothetical protein